MTQTRHTQVAIIGGGPVGLCLGLYLDRLGIDFVIFERTPSARKQSRSIGIHPVSLDIMEELGLAQEFLNAGIQIRGGYAFHNRTEIGKLSFSSLSCRFPFILSLPQYRTEAILGQNLALRKPEAIQRGMELTAFTSEEKVFRLELTNRAGEPVTTTCDYLIGCDGQHSLTRKIAGIDFTGGAYKDVYIMGEFTDNTDLGDDAAIYLHQEGLIESFPLPQKRRRWVAKTPAYIENAQPEIIAKLVKERLGFDLSGQEVFMVSSFGVQHYQATQYVSGRLALAGDAAHIVSPLGGQGMNLGWLDCKYLSDTIKNDLDSTAAAQLGLQPYESMQKPIAQKVTRRAEFNMLLGRAHKYKLPRKMVLKTALHTPIGKGLARLFAMQKLYDWKI